MSRYTCSRQSGQWWRRWKCIQYLKHSDCDNCCAYFCKQINIFLYRYLLYRPRTSSCPQCSIRTYDTWIICIILMCHTSDLYRVNLMLLKIYQHFHKKDYNWDHLNATSWGKLTNISRIAWVNCLNKTGRFRFFLLFTFRLEYEYTRDMLKDGSIKSFFLWLYPSMFVF